jgi:antitoxin component YwqK of YwqJK toxin-antitoxin module
MRVTASYPEETEVYGTAMNSYSRLKKSTMINSINAEIKSGKWKEFNKHAVLISEGTYVNNKKHGLWKEYYDHTGAIMIEEMYHNGIPHGRYTCFHPNGRIWSEGHFTHGLRQGYFRLYDEHGNNVRSLLFTNNKQIEETPNETAVQKRS